MKIIIIIGAIAATALGSFAVMRVASQKPEPVQSQNEPAQTLRDSPFACDTLALTPELRKRHFEELGPMLRSQIKSVHERSDGYEFEFPADDKTFALVTEWAFQERLCCPFFEINIRIDREGGPLWLGLTGRKGTKDFVMVDFAPWFKR